MLDYLAEAVIEGETDDAEALASASTPAGARSF
jgi:hypothetical protein